MNTSFRPFRTTRTADDTREELIAEMGSAFLCAALDIDRIARHADYIGAWLEYLTEDRRAIFRAASAASKAADWRLAMHARARSEDLEEEAVSASQDAAIRGGAFLPRLRKSRRASCRRAAFSLDECPCYRLAETHWGLARRCFEANLWS
jgi:hypothetical protein